MYKMRGSRAKFSTSTAPACRAIFCQRQRITIKLQAEAAERGHNSLVLRRGLMVLKAPLLLVLHDCLNRPVQSAFPQ
jgi:hypothetical protein